MPDHGERSISGKITHVFGHRFVVNTAGGDILADLTPKESERIALRIGDEVTIAGEMKPTELKVARFTRNGETVRIEHKKPHEHRPGHGPGHGHHHPPADPAIAVAAAKAAGYEPVGSPHRKPKHFEVLGRRRDGFDELHIELDGHIRKAKPVPPHDDKWSAELGTASAR